MITSRYNTDILLSEKYYYNPFKADNDVLDTYYESAHLGGGSGKYLLSSIMGNYMNVNIVHGLKSIKNSVMIIGGRHQQNIEKTINEYKTVNDSIESVILNKSRLLPHVEVSDLFVEKTKSFFK